MARSEDKAPVALGPLHGPSRRDVREAEMKARRNPWTWIWEVLVVVVFALIISTVLRALIIQVFWIPSSSMRPTLMENDRIVVSRLSTYTDSIQRGDVVVFHDDMGWLPKTTTTPSLLRSVGEFTGFIPAGGEQTLVKRVIGVGGDHVTCCTADGKVSVNGVPLEETYVAPGSAPSQVTFDITVPANHLWVMGDNRSNSSDSRYHRAEGQQPFVPVSAVVGRAKWVMWPYTHWATLSGHEVFAQVPTN